MIEAFTSMLHTYKSKIRNPFFGTLASVWIFRNWIIIYALFNFDKTYNVHYRINYIQNFFNRKEFWSEFWINILITFSVLIITYILFAISRFLTDLYYKICEPRIITLLDKKVILTEVDKSRLDRRISYLTAKLEQQNNEISRYESINHILTTKNKDLELDIKNNLIHTEDLIHTESVKYELLKNKTTPTNKVINYFDYTISGMSEILKKDILTYLKRSENLNSNEYKNYVDFKDKLQKMGIVIIVNGEMKNTLLGELFLEYFKNFK